MENDSVARQQPLLQCGAERSCRGAAAAELVAGRAGAAFARDRRAWCHQRASAAMACVLAWEWHACEYHTGAVASRLAGVRSGSCWAQVVVGMGCKASGRVLHLGVRLAAT